MTAPVPSWWPLATALAECLCDKLSQTVAGPPARCCLVAGESIALDDCCAGTAWVRLVTYAATDADSFPNPASGATGDCWGPGPVAPLAAVTFGIGVVRCAHTVDEDGTPPDCETLEADALAQYSDVDALNATALCCAGDAVEMTSLGAYDPFGPRGACVGGEVRVTYAVALCPCGTP